MKDERNGCINDERNDESSLSGSIGLVRRVNEPNDAVNGGHDESYEEYDALSPLLVVEREPSQNCPADCNDSANDGSNEPPDAHSAVLYVEDAFSSANDRY